MNDNKNNDLKEKLFSGFPPVSTKDWEDLIQKDLDGQDYAKKLVWHLQDGIKVRPYYRSEDLTGISYLTADSGLLKYRQDKTDNSWKKQQTIVVDNINEANKLALLLIENGLTSICFNSVRIIPASILNELLNGINPEKVTVCFAKSDCFRDQLGFYIEFLKENHFDIDKIRGYVDVDPFSNLMINGKFPDSMENVKTRFGSIQELAFKNLPGYKTINIRGHIYHNSGSTAAQELAFSLSSANEYLVMLTEMGFAAEDIISHIQFNFAIESDYFIEIAKLRAARILWQAITTEYQSGKDKTADMTINSISASWNKSIYDPYTNMLRLTTEAMSAIIGGADAVELQPFDFLYKKQNEFSLLNAINIQNLLWEESKFDKVLDPSAGSYYIENLTDLIASKAWDIFKNIENEGGFIESAGKGIIQDEISRVAEQKNNEVESRKDKILGVNIFPDYNEKATDEIEINSEVTTGNRGNEVEALKLSRKAISFENIRLKTEHFINQGGKQPVVSLFPVGNPAMSSARSMFSRNFLGVSGFKIVENNRFTDVDEGIAQLAIQKPDMVVICTSDGEYKEYVAKVTCKLKNVALKPFIIVAGFPAEIIQDLKEMGVYDFIHLKSNILESIEKYQKEFGIN